MKVFGKLCKVPYSSTNLLGLNYTFSGPTLSLIHFDNFMFGQERRRVQVSVHCHRPERGDLRRTCYICYCTGVAFQTIRMANVGRGEFWHVLSTFLMHIYWSSYPKRIICGPLVSIIFGVVCMYPTKISMNISYQVKRVVMNSC